MSIFSRLGADAADHGLPRPLADAISLVPRVDRFFGHYLASVTFVEDATLESVMATDCDAKIFYDPAALKREPYRDPAFLACVIVHELMHILRQDGLLLVAGHDAAVVNAAADACINRAMLDAGYLFPGYKAIGPWRDVLDDTTGPGLLFTPRRGDTTIDLIRELERRARAGRPPHRPTGDPPDILPDRARAAVEAAGGEDSFRAQLTRRVARAAERASADAAADARNSTQPNRHDDAAARGAAQSTAGRGGTSYGSTSPLAYEIMARCGVQPQRIENPLANIAGSLIRGELTARTRRTRSLQHPSPLSALYGYIVPGRRYHRDARPAIAIDVSGSISADTVQRYLTEAQQWLQASGADPRNVPVAYFNTRVVDAGPFAAYRVGGKPVPQPHGGTWFDPVFEWAADLPRRPSHLVIWTDLNGHMPSAPPRGVRVVWISEPQHANANTVHAQQARKLGKVIASK